MKQWCQLNFLFLFFFFFFFATISTRSISFYWLFSSLVLKGRIADLRVSSLGESRISWPRDGWSTRGQRASMSLEEYSKRCCTAATNRKGREKRQICRVFWNTLQLFNLRFIDWNSTFFRSAKIRHKTVSKLFGWKNHSSTVEHESWRSGSTKSH